jgi:hypothetical protein
MAFIGKELMLGRRLLRTNWFSFRLLYLKTVVRILGQISKLKN